MKKLLFISIGFILAQTVFAQNPNPWKSIDKPAPEILTLSNGRYPEVFENDSLRKVGSVVFNIRTNKIEYLIETDTMYSEATLKPEIVSRWLSIDPLARKFPSMSPYNFAANNPILLIDPDGKEPRLGQLGDKATVVLELRNAINNVKGVADQLQALTSHFEANRKFSYNSSTKSFDEKTSPAMNVKRYVYTKKVGWLDLHHFFRVANVARKNGSVSALIYAQFSEDAQALAGSESAFSYEDIPSNQAGISFWRHYGDAIENGETTFGDAFNSFLDSYEAVSPEDAPNYESIPYYADGKNPKVFSTGAGAGLKGDELKEIHSEIYNKRSSKEKTNITKFRKSIETGKIK